MAAAPLWLSLVVLWAWWVGRARCRLFVHSDSPNWKEHVEQHILPRLPLNSVVLNWSRGHHWSRFSLPTLLFRERHDAYDVRCTDYH